MTNFDNKLAKYKFNPTLSFIKSDWNGNPIDKNGRFRNIENTLNPKFSEIIKWQFSENPDKLLKKKDKFRVTIDKNRKFFNSKEDGLCWLGHASYILRMNGKLFIIDPVLGSPSFMMKRLSDLPFGIDEIIDIDYIMISHDHRDHLDKKSIMSIYRNNPHVKFITGLGTDEVIRNWIPEADIQTAGWYQKYDSVVKDLEIFYLPTKHWGKRLLTDTNRHLWGAFLFKSSKTSFYFGSDSGYGNHFREMAELFGGFHYATVGIGAYKPEWFMHSSHTSPADALQAAEDMKAKNLIPMHYGTFDLSDEAISDPYFEVQRIYKSNDYNFNLKMLNIGEFLIF